MMYPFFLGSKPSGRCKITGLSRDKFGPWFYKGDRKVKVDLTISADVD